MTFFNKCILYTYHELKMRRNIIGIVVVFITLLMAAATIPNYSVPLLEWNSTKDFILFFRYEFFHAPIFLVIVGSTFIVSDWILIRRYEKREHIGTNKVISVIIIASLFTFVIMIVGIICTFLVKFILSPNIPNYSSLFLYVPTGEEQDSFIYFIVIYFFLTTILGLLFHLFTAIIKNKVLSAAIIIIVVILDRFTLSLIPYFLYSSEMNSPFGTFIIFICITTILINLISFVSNNEDFFVQDDKI